MVVFLLATVVISAQNPPKPTLTVLYPTTCFYLDDVSDAALCHASAVTVKNGQKLGVGLMCNPANGTCQKLARGQAYTFEVVKKADYPECARNQALLCIKIHARPYDVIYDAKIGSVDRSGKSDQP
jgi:hypothetical protein